MLPRPASDKVGLKTPEEMLQSLQVAMMLNCKFLVSNEQAEWNTVVLKRYCSPNTQYFFQRCTEPDCSFDVFKNDAIVS
jgi:hypothetical protein